MGEAGRDALRVDFDRTVKLDSTGRPSAQTLACSPLAISTMRCS